MSDSDDRDALFERLCTVSDSYSWMIFLSKINQNGTLFGFLQFFLQTQPLTLYGGSIQS